MCVSAIKRIRVTLIIFCMNLKIEQKKNTDRFQHIFFTIVPSNTHSCTHRQTDTKEEKEKVNYPKDNLSFRGQYKMT